MNVLLTTVVSTLITAVLGTTIDPRCREQNRDGYAIHIPHPTDCTKFYKCNEDYSLSEETCPANLEFNRVLNVCDYPRGFCAYDHPTPVENKLDCGKLSTGAFYPEYENNCKTFYYCIDGVTKSATCAHGTSFDQEMKICTDEPTVKCKSDMIRFKTKGLETSLNHTTQLLSKELIGRSTKHLAEEFYLKPNLKNGCKTYFDCRGNEDDCVEIKCPEGYAFDVLTNICQPNERVFCDNLISPSLVVGDNKIQQRTIPAHVKCKNSNIRWYPDYTDCTRFWLCSVGNAYNQQCHSNQYFNKKTNSCIKGNCPYNGADEADDDKSVIKEDTCIGKPHGSYLANPADKTTYYLCLKGKKVLQECGFGQIFDTIKNYCRKQENEINNSDAKDKESCNGHPHGTYFEHEDGCRKFYLCLHGKKHEQICNVGQKFDKHFGYCIKGSCDPSESSTECDWTCDGIPEGSVKPHVKCDQFYVCVRTEWLEQKCDSGQYFNPATSRCEIDIHNVCKDTNTTPIPTTIPPELPCDGFDHGTFKPDDADCTKFYLCLHGDWRHLTCDPGFFFDKNLLLCSRDDGSCNKVVDPVTTTCKPRKDPEGDCDGHPEGSTKPDPGDCTHFKVCVESIWEDEYCGDGKYYDKRKGYCVKDPMDGTCRDPPATDCDGYPDGSTRPDPLDCEYFEVCVKRNWQHKYCGDKKYYDKKKGYCVKDPMDGTCRDPPATDCDGYPDGSTRPDPLDCEHFEVCVKRNWQHKYCGNDKYYSKKKGYCVKDPMDGTCRDPPATDCDGYPDGSTRPDPLDCEYFEVCVKRNWQHKYCGDKKYYDKGKGYCVKDPMDGTCRDPPATDCDGYPDGSTRPDPFDCEHFEVCVKRNWQHKYCGDNKYYDKGKGYCVKDPMDGTCRDPPATDCDGYPDGSTRPDPLDCKHFEVCVKRNWQHKYCGDNKYYHKRKGYCVKDPMDGTCRPPTTEDPSSTTYCDLSCDGYPEGTVKPLKENCAGFLLCLRRSWTPQSCSPGHYFNPTTNQCELDVDEKCDKVLPTYPPTTPLPELPCSSPPGEHGSIRPDANCARFYLCLHGDWRHLSCDPGFYFDPKDLICRVDKDGICDNTLPIPPPTPCPTDCDGSSYGSFKADDLDCTKFFLCYNNKWHHQSCDKGFHFDKNYHYCVVGGCEKCSGKPDGTTFAHEDPEKCNMFYLCKHDEDYLKTCKDEQRYDAKLGYCIDDTANLCKASHKPSGKCKGKPDGTFLEHDKDAHKFYVCKNEKALEKECPKNMYFNPLSEICVKEALCKGAPDGKFIAHSDPTKCHMFYLCRGGKENLKMCDPEQRFDSGLSRCVEDTKFECDAAHDPIEICKHRPHGDFIPHPTNKYKFYVCFHKKAEEKNCPRDMYFDKKERHCILGTSSVNVCKGKQDGKFIPHKDPFMCNMFYLCRAGDALLKECTIGQRFDRRSGHCVEDDAKICKPASDETEICKNKKDGEFIPDMSDPYKFYVCKNKLPLSKSCMPNRYFNRKSNFCESIHGLCEGKTDGTWVPHLSNPQKFYICKGEKAKQQDCGSSLYYSKSKERCVLGDYRCDKLSDGDSFVDDTDCKNFYLCDHNNALPKKCDEDQFYNPFKNVCVKGSCECKNNGDQILNLKDQTKFFICLGTKKLEKNCPGTLIFDVGRGCTLATRRHALRPKSILKRNGQLNEIECDGFPKGSKKPNLVNCNKYFVCNNGNWIQQNCTNGEMFDVSKLQCVSDKNNTCSTLLGVKECAGAHGRAYPDEEYCNRYYVCIRGQRVLQVCPDGFIFNAEKGICIEENQNSSTCKHFLNEKSLDVPICTEKLNGMYLEDPRDCTRFYMCLNNYSIPNQCPPGYRFNRSIQICEIDNGTCQKTYVLNSPPLRNVTVGPYSSDCYGKHGILLEDKINCQYFYACVYGKLSHEKCEAGKYFDSNYKICRENNGECPVRENYVGENLCTGKPDGHQIPDPQDCRKFVMCIGELPTSATCFKGQFYDSVLRLCRNDDGSCVQKIQGRNGNEFTCFGHHGIKIAHPNCGRYYLCLNGQAISSQCRAGYYFESNLHRCVEDTKRVCEDNAVDNIILDENSKETDIGPTKSMKCIGKLENRFYPNVEDGCQTFYSCTNGIMQIESCPAGLIYNPIMNLCDWPHFTKCSLFYPFKSEDALCVGALNGIRYPNLENDCRSFYQCNNGFAYQTFCGNDLRFDPTRNVCDVPSRVTCIGSGHQNNTFAVLKI